MVTEIFYYSAKLNCFVCESLRDRYEASAEGWPDDAKEISERWYNYLLLRQSEGRTIVPDEYGMPVLAPLVVNWPDKAADLRDELLKEAYAAAADWRTELETEILSDEDKEKLKLTMRYISQLKALETRDISDQSDYDAIRWPHPPALDWLFPIAEKLAGEGEGATA